MGLCHSGAMSDVCNTVEGVGYIVNSPCQSFGLSLSMSNTVLFWLHNLLWYPELFSKFPSIYFDQHLWQGLNQGLNHRFLVLPLVLTWWGNCVNGAVENLKHQSRAFKTFEILSDIKMSPCTWASAVSIVMAHSSSHHVASEVTTTLPLAQLSPGYQEHSHTHCYRLLKVLGDTVSLVNDISRTSKVIPNPQQAKKV